MVEGSDLYGDGVNIAARLESIAQPGSILVSGTVYDYVHNKVKVGFDELGMQTLKNIASSVRAYRVTGTPVVANTPPKAATDKPSIAVLPFTNMSGDPEQAYFSDGITEDIITELSRFQQFAIVPRSTAFRLREVDADVASVGRALGVQFVVEGSVRRRGEEMRITAQLADAVSGEEIWAERFDGEPGEIFGVQDEIVRTIVGTLAGRVQAAGAERARRKPPASLGAYECVLRGKSLPLGDTRIETEKRRLYEQAIALDPAYGHAHALLAQIAFLDWFRDMSGSDVALDRAFELAKKAVALADNDVMCQSVLGWIHLFRKSFALAEEYYQWALALNPSDPEQIARMGFLWASLGRPDDALDWLKRARIVDPYFNPVWYSHSMGYAHFLARQYDDAIAALERSVTMPFWVQAYLAACYALTGRTDPAKEFAREVLRLAPKFSSARLVAKEPFKLRADGEQLFSGLLKAGLPE
jgi:TolB-like protein